MLIINRSQVRQLLPMADCIEAVAGALAALANGEGRQPLRRGMFTPDGSGILALMPGFINSPAALGVKVIAVFDHEPGSKLESHQGGVMLFDADNGRPLALLEAGSITEIRTAAASAVATDLLARSDAGDLAILGTGAQARSHVEAMLAVRDITRVRLWGRTTAHAERLASEESGRWGIEIEVAPNVPAAIEGADIVCTTTSAVEPVLSGELLHEGMHINAVGASVPTYRELDTEAIRRSRLFTDRRESLVNEAGEYQLALKQGAIGEDHLVAEIGEVLIGDHPGRRSDTEITLFRSLGLAVEDLAAARLIYQRAIQKGMGTRVDLME
jgi:ornithine cyclodeaminase/alanine dehydrogenase-like protein (mu-crystallin family)